MSVNTLDSWSAHSLSRHGEMLSGPAALYKYIDLLESIQRRMSRIILELRHLDYPSRLRILKITTLETRRVRPDLLEIYKIINGLDSIFPADFVIMENEHAKTRGHPYKISKLHSRLEYTKVFFHSKDSKRLE